MGRPSRMHLMSLKTRMLEMLEYARFFFSYIQLICVNESTVKPHCTASRCNKLHVCWAILLLQFMRHVCNDEILKKNTIITSSSPDFPATAATFFLNRSHEPRRF